MFSGWLFIAPPISLHTGVPVPQAPLSAWHVFGTYAIRAECLNRRDMDLTYDPPANDPKFKALLDKIVAMDKQQPRVTAAQIKSHLFEWATLARCIASDDPRLKPK